MPFLYVKFYLFKEVKMANGEIFKQKWTEQGMLRDMGKFWNYFSKSLRREQKSISCWLHDERKKGASWGLFFVVVADKWMERFHFFVLRRVLVFLMDLFFQEVMYV